MMLRSAVLRAGGPPPGGHPGRKPKGAITSRHMSSGHVHLTRQWAAGSEAGETTGRQTSRSSTAQKSRSGSGSLGDSDSRYSNGTKKGAADGSVSSNGRGEGSGSSGRGRGRGRGRGQGGRKANGAGSSSGSERGRSRQNRRRGGRGGSLGSEDRANNSGSSAASSAADGQGRERTDTQQLSVTSAETTSSQVQTQEATAANGSARSSTEQKADKARWSSPISRYRQESEGLIGRYRRHGKTPEGRAPMSEFGFRKDFHDCYELEDVIGKGSFGEVTLATDVETGEKLAVKQLPKRFVGTVLEGLFAMRVQHEVDILNHLGQSLNVASLYGAYEDDYNVFLVMELCEGGELWEIIQQGSYTERDAARIIRQVLLVAAQCAAKGVVYRDIKPENFLFLDSNRTIVKAIDFGLAEYCKSDERLSERAGTPTYIAPEVLKMDYGQKSDVWSVGITAYQLLTGRLPFYGEEGLAVSEKFMQDRTFNNKDVFRAVMFADMDFEGPPWDEISREAKDLVMQMLQRDPERRPTAEQCLEHPWIRKAEETVKDEPFSYSIVQRLQRFGTYGRFKQLILRTVATSLAADSELVTSLQEMFAELDWCKSGRVFYSDLRAALESDRFNLSNLELNQLTSQMAIDEKGYIDYGTWIAAMVDWRKLQQSAEWNRWVEDAFERFQTEGRIGKSELVHMFSDLGAEVPSAVEAALREADCNQDEHITLEDFSKFLTFSKRDKLNLFDNRLADHPPAQEKQQLPS